MEPAHLALDISSSLRDEPDIFGSFFITNITGLGEFEDRILSITGYAYQMIQPLRSLQRAAVSAVDYRSRGVMYSTTRHVNSTVLIVRPLHKVADHTILL